MWIEYNANPIANRVEDCAIRAVAVAMDISWDRAFDLIARSAKAMGAVMHQNAAFGAVLRKNGFERRMVPDTCPECYTVKDFCRDHPNGVFIAGSESHVVAIEDGNYIDTFDSGDETVIYYWEDMRNGL